MSNLKDLMPALSNKVYFNYGGQGPLPQPSLDAIINSWKKIQELGPFTNSVWPYINTEIETTRNYLAKICGVPKHRLALTENVTSGCILPLWGLPFSPEDRILISDCEHPGVVVACQELAKQKNLAIDILPVQQLRQGSRDKIDFNSVFFDALNQYLNKNTRLLVLSHLLWNTGQVIPISLIASQLSDHPNKPFLLVDAAQSFGQLPIEKAASNADIYAFTGHKWACGPEGLGGVALSERILSEANPTMIGWRSLKQENVSNVNHPNCLHMDSRRYEIATSCVPLLSGLRCSLELLNIAGDPNQRFSEIQKKSANLWLKINEIKGVSPILKGPPPAGIVSFSIPNSKTAKEIVRILGRQGLWIRDLEEPKCLRACTHITTMSEEINLLVEAIKNINN